jgi:hypothetical protein
LAELVSNTLRHFGRLLAKHGIRIVIERDGQSCPALSAVPAKSTAKVVGADGSFNVIAVDDWLICVSSFKQFWPQGPQRGDCIRVVGDECAAYLIGHPDANTADYSNFNQLDRPALVWRIHSIPE